MNHNFIIVYAIACLVFEKTLILHVEPTETSIL